jgi:putative FmdB family regulatory protein
VPIYDYICSSCGTTTEVIHGIDASGPHFCPACGAEGTLRKAFATPAVLFKGSGWAKKDRAASSAPRARSGRDAGSSEAHSGEAAGPSKGGDGSGEGGAGAKDSTPSKAASDGSSADSGKSKGASSASGSGSGEG